ncbi:MAG: phosphoribosylanthranilate isomerase [Pseudohongiellaceae bacterium]
MNPETTLSKTWIKICGITRAGDALVAQQCGANAIGLVFYEPSSRAVTVDQVAEIVGPVDDSLDVVGLFVDPTAAEVERAISTGAIDILQFHGNESPEFCRSFGLLVMKVFRVGAQADLNRSISRYGQCEFILLDAFDKAAPGGTGKAFDWQLAIGAAQTEGVKLVLAGGLNPSNIREAVKVVKPFGVDVSTGVESSPGLKDESLVKEFIEGVRSGAS